MSKDEKHLHIKSATEIKQTPLENNEEIYKIKGKKQKKTSTKSKHKHTYEECLLLSEDKVCRATYCTLCGKIGDRFIFETVPYNDRFNRMLTDEEIIEKYKHLKSFEVDDTFLCKELKF
jgi:hypothetical protein